MRTDVGYSVDKNVVRAWRSQNGKQPLYGRVDETAKLREGLAVVVCTYKRAKSMERFLISLSVQTLHPNQLVVVDASPDGQTDVILKRFIETCKLADEVLYFRVEGERRGLTRQRNFGVEFVSVDKLAFFDDDIVLFPDCLERMADVHYQLADKIAGVGAFVTNTNTELSAIWRIRRALFLVPSLEPGRYYRSGISTPWVSSKRFHLLEGDWLPGGATMWKTAIVKQLGFCSSLSGYGQGEDLEFSLRARNYGRLVISSDAKVYHLHDSSGRPDFRRLGYMAVYNRYLIHRSHYSDIASKLYFVYAWTIDTVLLLRHPMARSTWQQLRGRIEATRDLLLKRHAPEC